VLAAFWKLSVGLLAAFWRRAGGFLAAFIEEKPSGDLYHVTTQLRPLLSPPSFTFFFRYNAAGCAL